MGVVCCDYAIATHNFIGLLTLCKRLHLSTIVCEVRALLTLLMKKTKLKELLKLVKERLILPEVTSTGSCEWRWSTFNFIGPKKCSRQTCPQVKNFVKVHCKLRLVDKIEEIRHQDNKIAWLTDENSD